MCFVSFDTTNFEIEEFKCPFYLPISKYPIRMADNYELQSNVHIYSLIYQQNIKDCKVENDMTINDESPPYTRMNNKHTCLCA